jgi:four helix bundle protein
MKENKLVDQSFDFAKDIIFLVKDLKEKRESVMSNQIGRSGTSIGANINEAQYAQSKADFVSKLQIALKEANETSYWLKLLFETGYIEENVFKELNEACSRIRVMLITSCKTAKNNMSNDIL